VRAFINAQANAAFLGKGHESVQRLGGDTRASLTFANIANIHAMRESYANLRAACAVAAACHLAWAPPGQPRDAPRADGSSSGVGVGGERGTQRSDERSSERSSDERSSDERSSDERDRGVVDSTLSAAVLGGELVLGAAAAVAPGVGLSGSSSHGGHGGHGGVGAQLGLGRPFAQHGGGPHWFLGVLDSRWLAHVSSVLAAARLVASQSEAGDPVLVHCSDGCDFGGLFAV
jgi:hypothetical protein